MTLDDYQQQAARTAARSLDAYPLPLRLACAELTLAGRADLTADVLKLQDIHIWAHGLAGEAGEVCDLLKKVHGHGKKYEPEALRAELGDVLWYVANLARAHGFSLSEVATANVVKLRARYPDGWSAERANNRSPDDV